MKKQKLFLGLCASLVVLGLASGCGEKVATTDKYNTTFTADLYTFDYLNTYHAADSEVLVNLVDGLVEHDEYGVIVPALAESWSHEVVDGNDVYTFKLKEGVKWVTSAGQEYAEVTADDFVAGMQHVLDTGYDALAYILFGVIKNGYEYSMGQITDFTQVGVKAKSKYEVQYTLEGQIPYFMKMIEYNPFMPLNREFFLSKGGALGVEAWSTANSTFGTVGEIDSILYNGAFIFDQYASQSSIKLVKNEAYWDAEHTTLSEINYVFNDGSNPAASWASFLNGELTAHGVSNTILETAKAGNADDLYVVETNSTTYFGAFNLNRKSYETQGELKSAKTTEPERENTRKAIANKSFRNAFQWAVSVADYYNAVSVGQELKNNSIRNMITAPEFVSLPTAAGGYAAAASYGSVVEGEFKKLVPSFTGSMADGQEGLHNATIAQQYREAAKTELAGQVTFPVHIDIVYPSTNVAQTNIVTAMKAGIEETLGSDFVVVDTIGTASMSVYYAAGYRAATGADANYDYFYGSGWGPDYGDPLTYVSIFGYQADMAAVIGTGSSEGFGQDDYDAYHAALGDYSTKLEEAKALTGSERYIAFAQCEAKLIESGVIKPMTTQGGNYAATRIRPRTVPYTLYGTDNEKMKHMIVHQDILSNAEILEYRADWAEERAKRYENPSKYYKGSYAL